MPGWDMSLLRTRLDNAGFDTHQFRYPSRAASPEVAAHALEAATAIIAAPVLHFVCHSMGGLVLRHFLQRFPDQRPGRVVTLATPHQGSRAAEGLARSRAGRNLLGRSLEHGLLGDAPPWPASRALGTIGGSRSLGLGRFLAPLDRPNDGTVAASEAMAANALDHIVVPTSHFGMLFSSEVAAQVVHFLAHGRFCRDVRGS